MEISFPPGFVWGAATASYQIEGGWNEDGRSPSIWDTYSKIPGKVLHGETGDVAADHYHPWKADVALINQLGIPAYRFSFAWPRILPAGFGVVNPKGLDFYDRLVDELLKAGIQPFPTLYHWDLPQVLEDAGGWTSRQTAFYFADYANVLVEHFSDRIANWITINEPWVVSMMGYLSGVFAPGITDLVAASSAVHNRLLGHGLAVQAMRAAARQPLQIGITLNLSSIESASKSAEDQEAARLHDVHLNRIFLDPLFFGKYPVEAENKLGFTFPTGFEKDLSIISVPTDFLGINNYSRNVMRYDSGAAPFHFSSVNPIGNSYSEMWEMAPQGLYDLLTRLKRDYPLKAVYITENGTAVT
ncbi:MAG TPA: family 1 glycosylhydrolase, partial [Leptolinea sp.]